MAAALSYSARITLLDLVRQRVQLDFSAGAHSFEIAANGTICNH